MHGVHVCSATGHSTWQVALVLLVLLPGNLAFSVVERLHCDACKVMRRPEPRGARATISRPWPAMVSLVTWVCHLIHRADRPAKTFPTTIPKQPSPVKVSPPPNYCSLFPSDCHHHSQFSCLLLKTFPTETAPNFSPFVKH